MVRLIDADDMIKSLMDMTYYDDEGHTIHDYEDKLAIVKSFVDSVPTVDAVPVIRCKDCGQREYGCSTFIDHNQIYGFCAWGWKAERKEE